MHHRATRQELHNGGQALTASSPGLRQRVAKLRAAMPQPKPGADGSLHERALSPLPRVARRSPSDSRGRERAARFVGGIGLTIRHPALLAAAAAASLRLVVTG
jgi:hypothetical protein